MPHNCNFQYFARCIYKVLKIRKNILGKNKIWRFGFCFSENISKEDTKPETKIIGTKKSRIIDKDCK